MLDIIYCLGYIEKYPKQWTMSNTIFVQKRNHCHIHVENEVFAGIMVLSEN